MRRNLILGIVGVVLFFGVGGASLWWLIDTVGKRGAAQVGVRGEINSALLSADGRHLTVLGGGFECGTPHLLVQESSVVVRLTYLVEADPNVVCQGGLRKAAVDATLDAPLGTRRLLDAARHLVPYFDAARLRPVVGLPSGYHQTASDFGGLARLSDGAAVTRSYANAGGDTIDVTESTAPLGAPGGRQVATIAVGGHRAVVYSSSVITEVQWSDGDVYFAVDGPELDVVERVAAGLYR